MTQPFVSPFGIPDDDVAAAEYAAAQIAEYSKWEAAGKITHGNANAYLAGHPIPTSNVERLGYHKRGQARLQCAYVERNPEDPDVQTFLAFGEKHPDHPDVRRYRTWLEQRKANEAQESAAPNPFAEDAEPSSKPEPSSKSPARSKPAGETGSDGRTAKISGSEG